MPKVLIIAESANPEWTSVPLVGWNLYRAIASQAKAHLVTQIRNREALLRAGLRDEDFTCIDNEWVARPVYRIGEVLRGGRNKGWTTSTAFSAFVYYSFETALWRQFRGGLEAGNFDIVHRITPLSPVIPSIIGGRLKRLGIPFVIGPLNGGVPWPPAFRDVQHREKEWLSYVRGAYRLLPGYLGTRRHARAIITGSLHTLEEMPVWARDRCVYVPENGVDERAFKASDIEKQIPPLRVLFVGRLVPYKGADVLLEAAAPYLRDDRLHVTIAGDGPEAPRLHALTDKFAISDNVKFHGWVNHGDVPSLMANHHVLALPSVREFGGGVVLEAMACGLPPLVADYAGPSELVTEQTGLRIPFVDRRSLIDGFARAFADLLNNPSRIAECRSAGVRRIADKYTWPAKAAQVAQVHEWVLGRRNKPGFQFIDQPAGQQISRGEIEGT